MRELAKEARGVDRQEAASTYRTTEDGSNSEKEEVGNGNPRTKKRSYNDTPTGKGDTDRTKTRKYSKMKCLNPKWKGDHPVRKCPSTSKEEASQLLRVRRMERMKRRESPMGVLCPLEGHWPVLQCFVLHSVKEPWKQ